MTEKLKISAFLVANQLDIKGIATFLDLKPIAETSSEIFYGFGKEKHQCYFNYGVIAFSGYSEEEMKYAIKTIHSFQKNALNTWMRDDIEISSGTEGQIEFGFNEVVLGSVDAKVIRIGMLNLAQSVATDYYNSIGEGLLAEVKDFATQLETKGRLKISRKNMLRFMGKALNTQNAIAENIYIFDAPDIVWDDEYLDKLHQGFIKHFDLRVRFNELEYTLRIIKDNLSVFREIYYQRESSLLEWIIIILILVEIFDLFISKIVNFVY